MKLFHFIKKHWQLYNSWYPNGTANKSKWSLSWKKGDRRITFNYGGFYIGFGLYLSPFFKLWLFLSPGIDIHLDFAIGERTANFKRWKKEPDEWRDNTGLEYHQERYHAKIEKI